MHISAEDSVVSENFPLAALFLHLPRDAAANWSIGDGVFRRCHRQNQGRHCMHSNCFENPETSGGKHGPAASVETTEAMEFSRLAYMAASGTSISQPIQVTGPGIHLPLSTTTLNCPPSIILHPSSCTDGKKTGK